MDCATKATQQLFVFRGIGGAVNDDLRVEGEVDGMPNGSVRLEGEFDGMPPGSALSVAELV
jgi:hypothetical protein